MKPLGDELKKIEKNLSEESTCKMPKDLIPAQIQLWFDENLRKIITPKSQSDRTSFRRISNWLRHCCKEQDSTAILAVARAACTCVACTGVAGTGGSPCYFGTEFAIRIRIRKIV